jgi:hypothetical protein
MNKEVQHKWNREELIIAYYIAKWDYTGLKISETELVNYVIGNSTVPSLQMQTANFRHLLGVEGYKLSAGDGCVGKKEIVDEMSNKTVTQVRGIIFEYIDNIMDKVKERTTNTHNKEVNKKRDALNAQEERNYLAQVAQKRKFRRLRKLDKES